MKRTRISTTVDSHLLEAARGLNTSATDARLIDAALSALLTEHREARIDAQYAAAYAEQPLSEEDEWGSLEDFHQAAARSRRGECARTD